MEKQILYFIDPDKTNEKIIEYRKNIKDKYDPFSLVAVSIFTYGTINPKRQRFEISTSSNYDDLYCYNKLWRYS